MAGGLVKNIVKFFLNKAGYDVHVPNMIPAYIADKNIREIIESVQPFTMTSP
ncbi:MAG: hypothetical protein ACI9BD_001311, partial [Candidatus Marinamargulisbacteria bacterium]